MKTQNQISTQTRTQINTGPMTYIICGNGKIVCVNNESGFTFKYENINEFFTLHFTNDYNKKCKFWYIEIELLPLFMAYKREYGLKNMRIYYRGKRDYKEYKLQNGKTYKVYEANTKKVNAHHFSVYSK